MKLLNILGLSHSQNDPYWNFEPEKHFKPSLNKGDFFRLNGVDFNWFILEPITKLIQNREQEIELGSALSYGQKALYYWWYVDAQVTNGGFVQFYYNEYGMYVPTIIKSLEYIGDKKMADLIQRAENYYQKNKKIINKSREKDLFDGDLYEQLEDFSLFDSEYYKLSKKTMIKIEKYIRKNPNHFCLDENGIEFNMKYTGECKTFHSNNQLKELFHLEKGIITGTFKSFHTNGNSHENIQFYNGNPTGEREEYYENGNVKYTVKLQNDSNQLEHVWYYENQKPKKLEHINLETNERIGIYKEWYENGQLAESGTYISDYERIGTWEEYYINGQKKLESEFVSGDYLLHNCWNENGDQTLINGTGVYEFDYNPWEGHLEHCIHSYQNYQRHGKQFSYINGTLSLYQEMENGIENGITKSYFNNGKLKSETEYENGIEVSKKEYLMFENPIVTTKIECEMEDEWLLSRGLELAQKYPVPINTQQIASTFNAPFLVFKDYPQDYELTYTYFLTIDEAGNVLKMEFSFADNCRIAEEVERAIEKVNFAPAIHNHQKVKSYIFINFKFSLDEETN